MSLVVVSHWIGVVVTSLHLASSILQEFTTREPKVRASDCGYHPGGRGPSYSEEPLR